MKLSLYFELKTVGKLNIEDDPSIDNDIEDLGDDKYSKFTSKSDGKDEEFIVSFNVQSKDFIETFKDKIKQNFPDFNFKKDIVHEVTFKKNGGWWTETANHDDLNLFFKNIANAIKKVHNTDKKKIRFFVFIGTKTPFEEKAKVRPALYTRILRSVGIEAKNIGENSNDEDVFMFKVKT